MKFLSLSFLRDNQNKLFSCSRQAQLMTPKWIVDDAVRKFLAFAIIRNQGVLLQEKNSGPRRNQEEIELFHFFKESGISITTFCLAPEIDSDPESLKIAFQMVFSVTRVT